MIDKSSYKVLFIKIFICEIDKIFNFLINITNTNIKLNLFKYQICFEILRIS